VPPSKVYHLGLPSWGSNKRGLQKNRSYRDSSRINKNKNILRTIYVHSVSILEIYRKGHGGTRTSRVTLSNKAVTVS